MQLSIQLFYHFDYVLSYVLRESLSKFLFNKCFNATPQTVTNILNCEISPLTVCSAMRSGLYNQHQGPLHMLQCKSFLTNSADERFFSSVNSHVLLKGSFALHHFAT